MLKVCAHQFILLGHYIHEHGGRLYLSEPENGDPGSPLSPADLQGLQRHLTQLSVVCQQLDLKTAKRGMDRAIASPPNSSGEFRALVNVVMDELEDRLFLFVPSERASYFERSTDIPSMPSAARELVRSGNCVAVGEYTASVFHAMRSVEVGLTAIYACLALPALSNRERSWGTICNRIKTAIDARQTKEWRDKNGGNVWGESEFFAGTYATLVAVKDAWRNSTMHVDITYDQTQAEMIFGNVTAFIGQLANRMDEKGLPLACPA
jgi:hypothetical protein